jgi:Leucine-rich repeat (LRR) protein
MDLDLRGCAALQTLHCYGNQLTRLNLSANTALRTLSCYGNQLRVLNLSANTELRQLECSGNQLTRLDLGANTALCQLECYDNRLQLSDLYKASEKISDPEDKRLGVQILAPRVVTVSSSINFSAQRKFGGVATDFYVEKDGANAPENDYAIINGFIAFFKPGNYTVVMINSTIVSHEDFPAGVIADFTVVNKALQTPQKSSSRLKSTRISPQKN